MGELGPGNDEGTSTPDKMVGGCCATVHCGSRTAGHGGGTRRSHQCPWGRGSGSRAAVHGEAEEVTGHRKEKRRSRCQPRGRGRRSSAADHGEEEDEVARHGSGKRKKVAPTKSALADLVPPPTQPLPRCRSPARLVLPLARMARITARSMACAITHLSRAATRLVWSPAWLASPAMRKEGVLFAEE